MVSKKFWIIGASHGIGHALALKLAQQGHQVALSGRSQAALAQIHQQIGIEKHLALELDITQPSQLVKAWKTIESHWQTLDSLVFMAGIYEPSPLLEVTQQNIEQTIQVNLMGAFYAIQTVLPSFVNGRHGQIAICGSVAGYRGLAKAQPYACTKAALINLAESLNAEYGEFLDVKLINPGFVETRLTAKNDFKMPAQLSTQEAATIIATQLQQKHFEIHFPKRFTFFLKLLKLLPNFLYFKIAQKLK